MSEPGGYVIRRRLRDGQWLYLVGGSALTGQATWFSGALDAALRFTTREEAETMRDVVAARMLDIVAVALAPAPPALPPRGACGT